MSANVSFAGSLAAAVLGAGTVATTEAPKSAKGTAASVVGELARTGVDSTVMIVVLATILLIAGLLLVSLARRHAPSASSPPRFDPSYVT